MSDLKKLASKLHEQVLEAQKTAQELAKLAHESDNHELKWLVLTEIHSSYFGTKGLPHYTEMLVEKVSDGK